MAAISVFCSDERLSQMALELEKAMTGMVLRGEKEPKRMDAAMARGWSLKSGRMTGQAAGWLMVGGRQTDGCRRSMFLSNHTCLMQGGGTTNYCFERRGVACTEKWRR
jgi:hypothetical protein